MQQTQLELVLKDDLTKLIPAMIAWNNAELMTSVKAILAQYESVDYGDDIAQAKADRTRLNNFTKSLNERRIEIKKVYSAPLDKFTAEVNEVIDEVKTVSDKISGIIAAHDDKIKAEKKAEIVKYYASVIGDLAELVPYEKIEDSKWYNATSKLKAICAEIDSKVTKIREDLSVIDSLGADDANSLKLFYFRTLNLAEALKENERIKQDKAKIAELNATQKEANNESDEDGETEITIRFEVTGSAEDFKKLAQFLNDNHIEYRKIKD